MYRIACTESLFITLSDGTGCMPVAVDPPSPSGSGEVIGKQLVVGCILLY